MNYFDIASRILQEQQAKTLKAIDEGKCVSCGINAADQTFDLLCPRCHQEEMNYLISLGRPAK